LNRILFIAAVLLAGISSAGAHDIPDDVRVQAFARPAGRTLTLLVRVPLKAMRDVDVPQRGGGFLDFARVDSALRNSVALWLADELELYEDDGQGEKRLASPRVVDARVSLESDRSFASFDEALAHFSAPKLKNDVQLYWSQGLMDVQLEYAIRSDKSELSINPRLETLGVRVSTVLRFLPPGGGIRAFEFHGDPGRVRLDPRWHQAALRFVQAGFLHILDGTDHLLFLLCLVIPFRRFLPLLAIITAFTAAHSVTLIATALGYGPDALWFPPLIEVLIAASILYMAIENTLGSGLRRRWILAFAFGLVHGFGFAFGLQELLQFAGAHLISSLLAFNAGVELGQLLVLILLIPVLNFLFKRIPERAGVIILSVLVGHTAWHWLMERGERLNKFPLPEFDAGTLASAMRWLMALLILAALAWAAPEAVKRIRKRG
jgi:hypothetical protein